jgi:hypothetical protein
VFYGLGVAYQFVNNAQVKAECARRITQMLDYLIANDWIIDEDRVVFDGSGRHGIPTVWLGIPYQKLTWLHLGMVVAPGRYDAEFQHWAPLSTTAWLGAWGDTLNVDHMYKFNLLYIGLYNYFRLETDPQRWQDFERGARIAGRYIDKHHNAHLDLIRSSIDPSLQATLHPATKEALRLFLERNHRTIAPAVIDMSNVTYVTLTLPAFNSSALALPGMGGASSSGSGTSAAGMQTVTMPSEALEPRQRKPTGFFLWQKDPFREATPGTGQPKQEGTGLDLTLPYWHGRAQGAAW